jgi:hypothetical protein
LFTPPGFDGEIPAGYLHVASPNYRIAFAFRSIPAVGKSAADAHAYSKRLRMYYLSEAANPPEQHFIDPLDSRYERYPTLPFYDGRHFEDMHAIMSVEPVRERDKVIMGMIASLGIEKGKPFAPDATAKKAMDQAVIDAWFFLQECFEVLLARSALRLDPDDRQEPEVHLGIRRPGRYAQSRGRIFLVYLHAERTFGQSGDAVRDGDGGQRGTTPRRRSYL